MKARFSFPIKRCSWTYSEVIYTKFLTQHIHITHPLCDLQLLLKQELDGFDPVAFFESNRINKQAPDQVFEEQKVVILIFNFFLASISLCTFSVHLEMDFRLCQVWLWPWIDFILILHSVLFCQLFCHGSVRPGTASGECYLFSDTFPGVSCSCWFSDLFSYFIFFSSFWMRLLLLMYGPDLSQSTLQAGK